MANIELLGSLVARNFLDLSIELKLRTSNHKIVVYLTLCPQSQENKLKDFFPHTNNTIRLKNIKFIRTSTSKNGNKTDYYIGNSSTTIDILTENDQSYLDALDDLLSVNTMMEKLYKQNEYDTNTLNLLQLMETYNLSEKHLEVYIWLPELYAGLIDDEYGRFSLFRCLSEEGMMKKLCLNQNNKILLGNKQFIMNTSTSVGLIGVITPKTNEALNRNSHCAPYFLNKQSNDNECLIGVLTSRNGKLWLEDGVTSVVLHIHNTDNWNCLNLCNKLVLILKYHVVCEIYPDGITECISIDFNDIKTICDSNDYKYNLPALVAVFNRDIGSRHFVYEFVIEAISPANLIFSEKSLEVWIVTQMYTEYNKTSDSFDESTMKRCNIALGEVYLSTVAFLDIGWTYRLYTHEALFDWNHGKIFGLKLDQPGAYFIPTGKKQNMDVKTTIPSDSCTINIKATIDSHFLNKSDTFKADSSTGSTKHGSIGMLAKDFQHRLSLTFSDGQKASFYLKHWEKKLTPEGLHPNVVLLITNVHFTGKYFITTEFTNIKVVGVQDALKHYNTANLNEAYKGKTQYESILSSKILAIKYYTYLRTKVYVKNVCGSVNLALKDLKSTFNVGDNNGICELKCKKFHLLFKFMDIHDEEEIKQYQLHGQYKKTIAFDEITQNDEIQKTLPFLHLWLQHLYYKLQFGLVSLDILCKKQLDGTWTIEDVYKVN